MMDTKRRYCIDRIRPEDLMRAPDLVRRNGILRAAIDLRKMWPNGSTLHVRFLEGTPDQHERVRREAAWWTEHANLAIVFDDAPDAQIRIAFDPAGGAWSCLGTDALKEGRSDPTMNLGFLDPGTVAHEFGHAIGLHHEHQSPSSPLEWNVPAVVADFSHPPNKWDAATVQYNVIERYSRDQVRASEYDSRSIMVYDIPQHWLLAGKTTSANARLSEEDKRFIAGPGGYPRTARPAATLSIGAPPRRATIGKPGEEDLFRFEVRKAGPHILQTGGNSDVVLRLYGPDDESHLLGEDDDSGVGANARIIARLRKGKYLAQVRHVKKRGTGAYTLRVSAR